MTIVVMKRVMTMSIHSIDGKPVATKLERISLRAEADVECVFNNLGHALDIDMLREQYHKLDGRKAIGIDGVTKQRYGEALEENLQKLLVTIRRGSYKPKPSKMVEIPKEDGSKRPLAIACFEDKLVQSAANAILNELYEPVFLSCSYGYRPNKSCHQALRALMRYSYENKDGAVVEIDIRKYFNTIPHKELLEMLGKKISDKRFLKLLETLMRAPVMQNGKTIPNYLGCPQGSIISPMFANIYLHYVVDEWFDKTVRNHIKGKANMVRFADDMVFVFERMKEAKKFYEVLPKRLNRFGLALHMEKSKLIASGRWAAARASKQGKRLSTYKFLGFTCYWAPSRKGFWRLKYKSRSDRFSAKLKGLRDFLWRNLNAKSRNGVIRSVIRVVKGWINYHAISDNDRCVKAFVLKSKRLLFKWINRRGRKHPINWEKFVRILKYVKFPVTWKITSMFESRTK